MVQLLIFSEKNISQRWAKKQLKEAEDVIGQENIILEKIESIRKEIIFKNFMIETQFLLDRSMDELKAGNFEAARSLTNQAKEKITGELEQAKYEKEKNDLVNQIEDSLR